MAENARLRQLLEYAYRVTNFGFEYGSFDFSVLRREAKAYFDQRDADRRAADPALTF